MRNLFFPYNVAKLVQIKRIHETKQNIHEYQVNILILTKTRNYVFKLHIQNDQ